MMKTTYRISRKSTVVSNKPIEVYEYDEQGTLVGFYHGYYRHPGVWTLYPKFNRLVWRLKENVKHTVPDNLILYQE